MKGIGATGEFEERKNDLGVFTGNLTAASVTFCSDSGEETIIPLSQLPEGSKLSGTISYKDITAMEWGGLEQGKALALERDNFKEFIRQIVREEIAAHKEQLVWSKGGTWSDAEKNGITWNE